MTAMTNAIHEVGHACVCVELRVPFRKVDIIDRRNSFGRVHGRKNTAAFLKNGRYDPRFVNWIERNIIVDFAGGLAQKRFAPSSNWAHSQGYDGPEDASAALRNCYAVPPGTDLDNIDRRLEILERFGDRAYRAELEAGAAALVRAL
jgi:hypothetical protein